MGIPLNNEEIICTQHSNKHTNNSVSDTKKRKREREGAGGREGEEVVKHVTIHISVHQVYKYRHASLIAAQTSDSICCCQKKAKTSSILSPSLPPLQVIIIYNTHK